MIRSPARCLALAAALASLATAQCATTWQPGAPFPGVNGPVFALTPWDADGPGPAPERLVVGGEFTVAGDVLCKNLAIYDPTTAQWSALPPLGAQPDRVVRCVAALPNGDLAVGMWGQTLPVDAPVFLWNGSTWTPLAYASGNVRALAVMPNGDLIAGGWFTIYFGPTMALGRWTGTTWAPYAGSVGGSVSDLRVTAAGDLLVAGDFATAGGVPAANVARWNGVTWTAFGSGLDAEGHSICERPNGDVVVAGGFSTAGGAPAYRVARWDGTAWSAIGGPSLGGEVYTLVNDPTTGAMLAGGVFTSCGGVPASSIAAWDGSAWSAFTPGVGGIVACIAPLANGHVAVAGSFVHANGTEAHNVAVWSGSQWLVAGPPAPAIVHDLAELPNGDVAGAGYWWFGNSPQFVARRTGGLWTPLGSGVDDEVFAVLALPNGDLIVGGKFSHAGGAPASRVARWDGTAWSPLGLGVSGGQGVAGLARLPNGDIVAAGHFTSAGGVAASNIARWNGSAWAPLGGGLTGPLSVGRLLAVLPSGDLVVAGSFSAAGGVPVVDIARWDGSVWSAMGAGLPGLISGLAVTPAGDVVAAGLFASGTLVRWDGVAWQPLPPPPPSALVSVANAVAVLPDGDVLAGFDGGSQGPFAVLRLDGSTWSTVGAADDYVTSLATTANGDVLAAGWFTTIDALVSPRFARLASDCPALATSVAPGCASSGGANVLAATSLPWLGGTLATVGTELPVNALVVIVRGFAPLGTPLPQLLPAGQPGCVLWVAPELVAITFATNGTAAATLTIPPTAALVGQTFGEQWVPLEFDGTGTLTSATGTNLLALTIGVL